MISWIEPFKPTQETDVIVKAMPKESAYSSYAEFDKADQEWQKMIEPFGDRFVNYRQYMTEIYDRLSGYNPLKTNKDNPFMPHRGDWPVTGDPA